jgi:malonate-semialdehyde dehydrogenase (acetylating)/methylmalonate-semialdehyde dehydrogenase
VTPPTREAEAPSGATVSLWINGAPHPSSSDRSTPVFDPSTGAVLRSVPAGDAADVDRALQAATAAFAGWAATPPLRRARVLNRFRDLLERHQRDLAAIVTQEHGKVFGDALGSVQRGLEVVEFATGIAHLLKGEHADSVGRGVDAYSRRHPVGVCVGITPFNFPVMVPLWMFPVALACGNTFVLKPSERDPSASVRLAELARVAGVPDGVLNVVHGGRTVVDALLTDERVQAVSFVGSTPVARHVYLTAAAHGKRVQALGGAKNHAVVLPDADLEFAADAIVGAAFGSAGERCMAISVVVAVGGSGEPLVGALAQRARRLRVGPGMHDTVDMGPLVTREHSSRVRGYVDAGVPEGAAMVVDGRGCAVPNHEEGFFIGPTLFDHVTAGMSIYRDEIFGPVQAVVR